MLNPLPSVRTLLYWFKQRKPATIGRKRVSLQLRLEALEDRFVPSTSPTTTAVTASVGASTYGTSVTFTATVTSTSGSATPTGSVEFFDRTTGSDLGAGTLQSTSTGTAIATYASNPTQLQVSRGAADVIEGVYASSAAFLGSVGTLAGGEKVAPFALTVSGVTAANKVYNQSNQATINTAGATLKGILSGDMVTPDPSGVTGSFAGQDVGNGIAVTVVGLALSGPQAGNYTLTQPVTKANITPATLTVTGVTANNKVYDATKNATLNTGQAILASPFPGDTVTLTGGTGIFASKDVGNNIPVTAALTLGGAQSGDYAAVLNQPQLTANISPAPLGVTGITTNDKIYDGTASATVKPGPLALVGVFGRDSVFLDIGKLKGTFASKDAGTNLLVNLAGLTISGPQASDYTLTPTTTGNITPLHLTVSGVTMAAYDKLYDATTAATLKPVNVTLAGLLAGDKVTLAGGTGVFASKDVGANIGVSVTGLTLGGAQAGDYTATLSAPQHTVANITAAPLTLSGIAANDKLYDGTTKAILNIDNVTVLGLYSGDNLALNATGALGTFASKDVGNDITVSVTGLTITGAQVSDYSLLSPLLTANIELVPPTTPFSMMVKNIKFSMGYTPLGLVNLNGTVLFEAADPVNGPALWKSDGTAAGTVVVTKLPNFGIKSNLSTAVGKFAFFTAYDNLGIPRLWRTDGTASGTFQVNPVLSTGFESFTSSTAAIINDVFYFSANDSTIPNAHFELWRSDGTVAGTYRVNAATGSDPNTFTNVNGTLYFFAYDAAHGQELWKSDGTTDGTVMVKDITPGPKSSLFRVAANVNGTLFFTVSVDGGAAELWRSDGTDAGTYLVYAASALKLNTVDHLTPANNLLYFTILSTDRELWRTDGTTAGTFMVKSFPATTPHNLVNVNGTLFFMANDGVHGIAPWMSDGTVQGTRMIRATNPAIKFSGTNGPASPAVSFNGLYFFVADDAVRGQQLWSSDGTQAGTSIVSGIYHRPGPLFDFDPYLTIAGDKLLFVANDGVHGLELWRLDYAPTVTDHKYLVNAGNPLIVTGPGLLQDALDRDNDTLTALLVSGPSHGQLALNLDGSFTYTPAPGFEGNDTFTYTAQDPYTFGNLATVNLAVGLATATTMTSSQSMVTYGTSVTFTATVTTPNATPIGSVEFFDDTTGADLGAGVIQSSGAGSAVWSFTTTARQLQANSANTQSIRAVFTGMNNFLVSSNTLPGGETVNPVVLAVTGIAANNKVYDQLTAATLNTASEALVGILAGDKVFLNANSAGGMFASRNVGTGIPVTASGLTLDGAQAGDYILTQPTSTAAITPAPLLVTTTANTKVYDGTTSAAAVPAVTGLMGSDLPDFVETYANSGPGAGIKLTPRGIAKDGNNGHNYTYTYVSANTGTINPPNASITYKPGYAAMTEPAPRNTLPYYFTIALDDISPVPVTVYYQTRDGSAQAGEDYRGVNSYRVTFPAFAHGATANSPPSQDIAITVNGDASDGTDPETFAVVLTSAYNATIKPTNKSATGTIKQLPSPPAVTASIADFSAAGPSAGSTVFDVPLTLANGPAAQPITVYYSTTDGTAKSGVDYVGQNQGHVTIAAGQTSADIPITVFGNAAARMNETFTITLYNPVNATLGSSTATITIVYPPAAPATVISADSLNSWSPITTVSATDALDQVFAQMGADKVKI